MYRSLTEFFHMSSISVIGNEALPRMILSLAMFASITMASLPNIPDDHGQST